MKKLPLIVAICIGTLPLFGQTESYRRIEIGVTAGNNGQLDKTLNDFYFPGHETANLDDTKMNKVFNMKFGLNISYRFAPKWGARIKAGYAMRRENYHSEWPNIYNEFELEQNVLSLSGGIFYADTIGKLLVMTGAEVNTFAVTDFNLTETYRELHDSVNITYEQYGTQGISGGLLYSVNHFAAVRYSFTSWLSAGGEVTYGMMWGQLGGTYKSSYYTTIPVQQESHRAYAKKMWVRRFTAPELSVGVYFSF